MWKFCKKKIEEDADVKIFDTSKAHKLMFLFKKFLKAKELGRLEDNSDFKIEESDVNLIEYLELHLEDYMDLFYDIDSGKFNQERYDSYEYKHLVEFNDCFERFKSKVYIKETTYIVLFDSDSDSDSDSG